MGITRDNGDGTCVFLGADGFSRIRNTEKVLRYLDLVAIRKEVKAGTRRFAHDGEIMLLLEENALHVELH